MDRTHTTSPASREEMIELLTRLDVTTTLVRLAESREDHAGVCGAFTVRMDPRFRLAPFTLEIDLRWAR